MSQPGSDPLRVTTAHGPFIGADLRARGFLPAHDPLTKFADNSELAVLDEIGRDLPSLLHDSGFRAYARSLTIPRWPENRTADRDLPELRLYYVRVGFLASAYINQVGQQPSKVLPANLALPLCRTLPQCMRFPALRTLTRTSKDTSSPANPSVTSSSACQMA